MISPCQSETQRYFERLFISAILLLNLFLFSGCSNTDKPVRIGILIGIDAYVSVADSFMSEMENLGFVPGDTVSYDVLNAHGDETKMKEISKAFVDDSVNLIFSITHKAARFSKQAAAGTDIPVLFSFALAQDKSLINSLREPGGNITGVRFPIPDMAIKRFEYLLEIKPGVKRLLLPYMEKYPGALIVIKGLKPVAAARGVELVEFEVDGLENNLKDVKSRLYSQKSIDAVQLLPEPVFHNKAGWGLIRDFAADRKIPIAGIVSRMALDGSAFTYNPDEEKMGAMAAPLAKKIINGTPAGTIPVVSPEIELRINYKNCQALGLTVPESMLKMASEIIR